MNRLTRVAFLACAIGVPLAAAAQYRWTDADGKVTFGDAPPPGAKNVQRLGESSPGSSPANANYPYELRIAVERFPVTLYTTAKCAPCDAARSFLLQRGVPYNERTVTFKEEAERMQRDGLGTEFPVATIGRQTQRGFDSAAWTVVLDASGYPAQSRLPPNWRPAPPQPLIEPPKQAETRPAPSDEPPPEIPKGVQTPDRPLVFPPPPPAPAN
jgi:glutaredoxin